MTNQIGENKTAVELTPREAELFLEFRKHQSTFETLYDAGVFNLRNGRATIDFNNGGELTEINFNIVGYRKNRGATHTLLIHTL